MSYARKGLDGSHVYVYTDGKRLHCHECSLSPTQETFLAGTSNEMLAHLRRHINLDETVPAPALERLRREARRTFSPGLFATTPASRLRRCRLP